MIDNNMSAKLSDAYMSAKNQGLKSFKVKMNLEDSPSKNEIQQWFLNKDIKANVFTNWGNYEIEIL